MLKCSAAVCNSDIMQDAQWNDLDYSKDNLDWTFDNQTYQGLQDIIDNLHSHGQHYIIIVVRYFFVIIVVYICFPHT